MEVDPEVPARVTGHLGCVVEGRGTGVEFSSTASQEAFSPGLHSQPPDFSPLDLLYTATESEYSIHVTQELLKSKL